MSMPSYWFDPFVGGGGTLGGNAATGQPAMSSAQINASMGWNPAAQTQATNIYTPGGFGALTDHYSGLGAAYGRATGGFGGYGAPNADPFTPVGGGAIPGGSKSMNAIRSGTVTRGPDLPAPPTNNPITNQPYGGMQPQAPFNSYDGGANPGGFSPSPNYVGGGAIPGGSASMNRMRAGGQNPYAGMILGPMGNPTAYNPGAYAGDQSNYGIPFNGRPMAGDIGFSAQPQMPNLGYNPGMQNSFANPGMNANQFQNRFGMGFPNAGTPSQYAPGAQMPPGFLSPYSVDNPQGALPLGWSNSFNN